MSARTDRTRMLVTRIAWALVALYVVLVLIGLRLETAIEHDVPIADLWVYFVLLWQAIIGALIVGRYPTHAVGRLFIAVALSFGIALVTQGYAIHALVFDPGSLPGGEVAAWISFWITYPGIASIALFLPLFFPDGHLPSRRWRPAAWASAVLLGLAVVIAMVAPDAYTEYPNIRNPIGLDVLKEPYALWNTMSEAALILLLLISSAALFSRMRRADTVQRLQIRWFAFAVAVLVAAFVLEVMTRLTPALRPLSELLAVLAVTALPTAAGIAILRYRLYDIDVIINRTVVYVGLTAVLAGLYSAAVALFQRTIIAVTGESSDLAVVLTLFVLATVFTPIKNTLQSSADKYIKPVGASGASLSSAIDDLVRLAELHARGILTDEEFAAKKKQVLGIGATAIAAPPSDD